MSNYQQFVDVIYQALSTAPPANDIVPGRFIRFPVPEGARNKNGYCKMFDDCSGGVFYLRKQGYYPYANAVSIPSLFVILLRCVRRTNT